MYILAYFVFAGLCCNSLQASDNNLPSATFSLRSLMPTFTSCYHEAEVNDEQTKVTLSVVKDLDEKLTPDITNLIIEMLVDRNRYLSFNVNAIRQNYKPEKQFKTCRVDFRLYQLNSNNYDSREIIRVRLRLNPNNQETELEGRVDHCACPMLDDDCSRGSCKSLIQSWPVSQKRTGNIFVSRSRQNTFQLPTLPMLSVKREGARSSPFTIDVLGDDCRGLIRALGTANASRFGHLLGRIEIERPGYCQHLFCDLKS